MHTMYLLFVSLYYYKYLIKSSNFLASGMVIVVV